MEKNVIFMLRVVKKFVKIRWRKKPEKRVFSFLDNNVNNGILKLQKNNRYKH